MTLPPDMQNPPIGLALGTLLGGIIGWLLGLRQAAAASNATLQPLTEELRQQLAAREALLMQTQGGLAATQSALAAAQATQQAVEKSAAEQRTEDEKALREAPAA